MKRGFLLAPEGTVQISLDGMDQDKVRLPRNLERPRSVVQSFSAVGHTHELLDRRFSVIAALMAECKVRHEPQDFGKDIEPDDPTHGKEFGVCDNTAREGKNTSCVSKANEVEELEEVD